MALCSVGYFDAANRDWCLCKFLNHYAVDFASFLDVSSIFHQCGSL